MFDTCVDALGVGGRLIVIGFISGYKDQSGWTKAAKKKKDAGAGDESKASGGEEKPRRGALQDKGAPLPVKLLAKSAVFELLQHEVVNAVLDVAYARARSLGSASQSQ